MPTGRRWGGPRRWRTAALLSTGAAALIAGSLALTATEAQRALAAGHTWLKMFPASTLGPRWLRELRGPFPDLRFVATGGIDADSAAEYLGAGAAAVGVGSAIGRPGELDRLVAAVSQRDSVR